MCDVLQLSEQFALGQAEQLDRLLERMSEGLPQLSDAVSHKYLFHASPYQQLTALDPLAPI